MLRRRSISSSKSASPIRNESPEEEEIQEFQGFVNQGLSGVERDREIPPPIHDVNVNIRMMNKGTEPHPSDLSGDTEENPSIQYDYTRRHPLGQILIAMLTENTKLAEKCNLKDMTISMDDMCRNFYNFQLQDKQKMKNNIMQTTAHLENSLIERELNSHIINQSIAPPQYFSSVPTLLTPKQRADCLKLIPIGSSKFNGSDKGMSILEFLHHLNTVQKNCNLSLPEFYEIILASTTGQAYLLVHSWIEGGESPETIYHNLLLHYDKRIHPEEARIKLMSYKAPRNVDLAKVEAHIQSLASRASSTMPAGPERIANYNMEVIQGLIRCLPTTSSRLVQSLLSEKSTRHGRGLTATELSRYLNTYRASIDTDIKEHGVDPREGVVKRQMYRAGNIGAKRNAVYGVRVTNGDSPLPRQSRTLQRPISPIFNQINQVSTDRFRRPGGNRTFGTNPNQSMKKAWDDKYGIRNSRIQNKSGMQDGRRMGYSMRRPFTPSKNSNNSNYCSLCGSKSHLAIDGCPNMKSDSGQVVSILPSKDTCNSCPAFVNPRLSHPSYLCPYRKTGPWGNKNRL